ncbi:glycoside hydrolase family 43 protein [Sorangium sp. So ce590]|uniref:glycoside hydrolase family 43 protein n=1 Tax=unclassified Sorangium TaxID=2621164 RepID=UPI003F62228F
MHLVTPVQILVSLLLLGGCGDDTELAGAPRSTGAAGHSGAAAVSTNPVVPGDFADPSVIRVGHESWATATSSEWGAPFPLLRSTDLVNWERVDTVFPELPSWAAGSLWAPEISEDGGRYDVFYTARQRGGPLCVAAASAAAPGGPYTDHGPLTCMEVGSLACRDRRRARRRRARFRVANGALAVVAETRAPDRAQLRMTVADGHLFRFTIRAGGAAAWAPVGDVVDAEAGPDLPPWDRGVRAALFVRGPSEASARFASFRMAQPAPRR